MTVQDIMSSNPTCCTPDTLLKDVARKMFDADCGEIHVVDNLSDLKPLGVITDRDIICRVLAQGRCPLDVKVRECMTQPCITIYPDTSIEECCRILEDYQIRRIPVVDDAGSCIGMVTQADLATHHFKDELVEVLEEVSQRR
jgi:CBS domain-containing protein